jgi:hypothetical protein
LPVKGAASPDEDIQLNMSNVLRCYFPHYFAPFLLRRGDLKFAAMLRDEGGLLRGESEAQNFIFE